MTVNLFSRMTERSYKEIDITALDASGTAIDITNITLIKGGMAPHENASEVLLEKSYPASGIVLKDAGNGVYTVVISGVDTTDQGGDTYFQQSYNDDGGQIIVDMKGTIKIDPIII